MKKTLTVITLVTRPDLTCRLLFPNVKETLLDRTYENFDVEWMVVPDPRKVKSMHELDRIKEHAGIIDTYKAKVIEELGQGFNAGYLRNLAVYRSDTDYIWFLDDDNACSYFFGSVLDHTIRKSNSENASSFVFDQVNIESNKIRKAASQNMRLYYVDLAQVVFHVELLRKFSFREHCNTEDGILIENAFKSYPEDFVFVNIPVTYHNYYQQFTSKEENIFFKMKRGFLKLFPPGIP